MRLSGRSQGHRAWLAGFGNGERRVPTKVFGGFERLSDARDDAELLFARSIGRLIKSSVSCVRILASRWALAPGRFTNRLVRGYSPGDSTIVELEETLTIHLGRHTFISHALAGGRTLAEARNAVGHANVSVISSYLHVAVDDDEVRNLFAANS